MKKNLLKSTLLVFAILFYPTIATANCSHSKKILITGGLAIGGFVLFKLYQMGFFDKPEGEVINESLQAIQSGLKLSEVDTLDNFYNILSLSESEKRKKIDSIHEGVLYKLLPALTRYSNIDSYLNNIDSVISNIKACKKDLKRCLKNTHSKHYDINNLLVTIDNQLPKLEFLYSYVKAHSGYFNLSTIVNQLDLEYEREINLVNSSTLSYQDFKWIIRNSGSKINPKYPFTNYINNLNNKINSLKNSLLSVTYKYSNLLRYAQDVQYKLNVILDNAIADEEYSKEIRDFENESRKKQELEIKERELALKQKMEEEKLAIQERQAKAREREAAAREREAKAREYELHLKDLEHRR